MSVPAPTTSLWLCRVGCFFFREVAEERGGDQKPRAIISLNKAWQSVIAPPANPPLAPFFP